MLGLDPERSQMFWIVLVHYLRKALQIVTIARVSQQGLGFIHVHAYNILSMPELVWKFSTFKSRWFSLFAMFAPLNVWTDEGQPCDYSASCSILPAFRMCTHHYTTCVGIPIFRHQSYPDKGRLIQKSPVCWDYVLEMGFARGKR